MDPFTAIGLASSIVQFIDYSAKITHGAREIYDSGSGMTEDNKSLESVAGKMKELSSKLLPTTGAPRSEDEQALCRVAAECNILSDQILDLLGKIKPKDSKSKRQIAFAAVKNKLREREKLELEKRLANCRSQLELQLSFLTSSETKTRLETLLSSSKGDSVKLDQLQTHIETLRKGVVVTSISPEARSQLQELLDLSEDACRIIIQQRILNSLAFEGMHGRFEAVEDAHCKTFEWIFEPDSKKDNQNGCSGPESFKHWLSSGRGIFHISGKLGSGKSTLMKFLCEHKRTKNELQKWSGNRKLVFANFFFWKPGMQLQRSLGGLLRSLLYDVLKSCPELIPTVLPNQWNEVQSMPWQVQSQLQFSTKNIRAAFSRLCEVRNLYERHCFCYFIDGLDEYEETHQEDYKSMVEILSSWTTASPDDVKICVSSREYNVFLNGFSSERRIRLQDLTKEDMQRYVRDKLQSTEGPDSEKLVQAIVDKGNGIFLWVALVVKSLRERLEDGHELSALEAELDALPEELEGLFTHLLMSLDTSSRKKTYQFFAMILKSQAYKIDLSPLACSFLENFNKNSTFAMEPDFPYYNMKVAARNHRITLAHKRINGYCRGLLESNPILAFTHRSIPEFLERPATENDMAFWLKDFDVVEAISQLLLAEMRSTASHTIPRQKMSLDMYRIVSLRYGSKINQAPFSFLESLSMAIKLHEVAEEPETDHMRGILYVDNNAYIIVGSYEGNLGQNRLITSPLYASAIIGDFQYVKWMMENDKETLGSDYQIAVLLCSIYRHLFRGSSESFKHLGFLLKQGLSPQALIHTNSATICSVHEGESSFWVHFILTSLELYNRNCNSEQRMGLGGTLESFLQYRADPRLSISVPGGTKDSTVDLAFVPLSAQGEASKKRRRRRPGSAYVEFIKRHPKGDWKKIRAVSVVSNQEYEFITRKGGRISLRELIEFWEFENQEAILQLFDRNLEELQRENGEGESESEVMKGIVTSEQLGDSQSELTNESILEPGSKKADKVPLSLLPKLRAFDSWLEIVTRSHVITFILGVVVAIFIARLL